MRGSIIVRSDLLPENSSKENERLNPYFIFKFDGAKYGVHIDFSKINLFYFFLTISAYKKLSTFLKARAPEDLLKFQMLFGSGKLSYRLN